MANRFTNDFELVIGTFREALDDGKLTLSEALRIAYRLLDAARGVVETVEDPSAATEAEAIAAWENIFDEHLGPLNLPYIPGILEKALVDPAIKAGVSALISEMFRTLRGE